MTELLRPYPDAEDVMLNVLGPLNIPVVTATPETITPPLAQVTRVGGADDGLTDHPHLEVAVFAATRADAWRYALAAQQLVLAARHSSVTLSDHTSQALIDHSVTVTPAEQVPYPDQDQRLVVAVYQLSMRRSYVPVPWSPSNR